MIIFDEPGTAPYIGVVFAIVCFAIQLLLCFKVKKTSIRCIPVYIILVAWGFILLLCTGIFGTGSGFLGNVHLMVAAILTIVLGVVSIGNIAAWIVYKVYTKSKEKRTKENDT